MAFSLAGFGQAVPAFNNAAQGTNATIDQFRKMQAQAQLAKILQQYANTNQQGGGQPQPTQGAPMPASVPAPAMSAQPGGVSPAGGGAAPAVGASGGAGPISLMGGASAQPGGIDMQRLLQAVAAQKGMSGGAQGYALQDAMKMLQPQANNATKIELLQNREAGQDRRLDKKLSVEEDIAERREARMSGNASVGMLKQQLGDNKAQIDTLLAGKTPKEQVAVFASPEYVALKNERQQLIQAAGSIPSGGKAAPKKNKTAKPASAPAGSDNATTQPVKITGDADWEKLAPGTTFVGPDGVQRTK